MVWLCFVCESMLDCIDCLGWKMVIQRNTRLGKYLQKDMEKPMGKTRSWCVSITWKCYFTSKGLIFHFFCCTTRKSKSFACFKKDAPTSLVTHAWRTVFEWFRTSPFWWIDTSGTKRHSSPRILGIWLVGSREIFHPIVGLAWRSTSRGKQVWSRRIAESKTPFRLIAPMSAYARIYTSTL